jgi:hypothetical protein
VADADFDFEQLVSHAVVCERELEDDDTEGDELESALSAISLSEPLSLDPSSCPPSEPPMSGPSHVKSKPAAGSTEADRRKHRSHMKHAVQHLQAKCAAPYGQYSVTPKVLNTYVRPATSIDTKLNAIKLKHTKHAYIRTSQIGWRGLGIQIRAGALGWPVSMRRNVCIHQVE